MGEISIGNITKNIPNAVMTSARTTVVDSEYWYSEIYGKFPVYRCEYGITMSNNTELRKLYGEIFKDLTASGEFTVLDYYYGNKAKEGAWDEGEPVDDYVVNNFCIASNTEPVFISFEYGNLVVMSSEGIDVINNIIDKYLKKYAKDDKNVKAYIIVRGMDMYLNEFDINLKSGLDFGLYNEGFEEVHNELVRSLKDDANGIYLLYGCPGSGKTTYIRHLIKQCSTREMKFVYVPSDLMCELTTPSFLSFLIENKGCVFILEDCESLVTTVDGVRSGVISNLLNMSDGLLADALKIKFICTFNTDEGEIDEALLRPGRCRTRYKFELLDKDRANEAAERLGLKPVDDDVSLAELFNPDKDFKEDKKKERKLGFK